MKFFVENAVVQGGWALCNMFFAWMFLFWLLPFALIEYVLPFFMQLFA